MFSIDGFAAPVKYGLGMTAGAVLPAVAIWQTANNPAGPWLDLTKVLILAGGAIAAATIMRRDIAEIKTWKDDFVREHRLYREACDKRSGEIEDLAKGIAILVEQQEKRLDKIDVREEERARDERRGRTDRRHG